MSRLRLHRYRVVIPAEAIARDHEGLLENACQALRAVTDEFRAVRDQEWRVVVLEAAALVPDGQLPPGDPGRQPGAALAAVVLEVDRLHPGWRQLVPLAEGVWDAPPAGADPPADTPG